MIGRGWCFAIAVCAGAPPARVLQRGPADEYIFKLGIHELLIISELGIQTSA